MGKTLTRVFVLLMTFLLVFGCRQGQQSTEQNVVTLAYVDWSSEVASTNMVRAVLQEKLDYEVKLKSLSASGMWQAVASGEADAMVAAWLPTTHGHYLEEMQRQVVDLGPNLEQTRIGLAVPAYVTIDAIPQLGEHAERFAGRIVGIDPGAGLMARTEQAVREYGLEDFTLIAGRESTMIAALEEAIQSNKWIVVTAWTPHWKFARWDLKYLEDPGKIYGGAEEIHTIVRSGLDQEMPEVYLFLKAFQWTPTDMNQVMAWNREEGADPYESAKRWMRENPEKVETWLPRQIGSR